jgi:hypothetical protein
MKKKHFGATFPRFRLRIRFDQKNELGQILGDFRGLGDFFDKLDGHPAKQPSLAVFWCVFFSFVPGSALSVSHARYDISARPQGCQI